MNISRFVLAAWLCLQWSTLAQATPPSTVPQNGDAAANRRISLDLTDASLADVVRGLGKLHGLDVVADAYADDPVVPRVRIADLPVDQALARLAGMYERDVLIHSGVVVLRHHRWFARPSQGNWKDGGSISIQRADGGAPAAAPGPAPHLLSWEVKDARLREVAAALSERAEWTVGFVPALTERRISASLHGMTPGRALEALTLLLNARQQVVVGQSEAQLKREAERAAEANDHRTEREKASDALLPELLNLLTPEQRAQVEEHREVPLLVGALPAGLQKRVIRYLDSTSDGVQAGLTTLPLIDKSRFREFQIVILPPPSTALGVNGFFENGGRIGF